MATCPNCGHKLRITDWKPDCPNCKVNLVYYGMDEKLQDDADKAEAEHARVQKKIDRLKASFVGSPLTLARLILSALTLGPLFLIAGGTRAAPFQALQKRLWEAAARRRA